MDIRLTAADKQRLLAEFDAVKARAKRISEGLDIDDVINDVMADRQEILIDINETIANPNKSER